MKRLFQTVTLTSLIIGFLFYSCRKDRPCESCQTTQPPQPTSNTNKLPIALAGADQTITLPTDSILLNGSASNDPDGSITVWQWTKISGPTSFNIVNAGTVQTHVSNLLQGIYQFELKVTDNAGHHSKDTVQVTVLPPIFNPSDSKVYIAGWGKNASGKTVARIWGDGVAQDLSDGQYDAYALSVFVSGTDIYVAGYERDASGKSVAKVWKNGVSQNLSNGQYDAGARSAFVSGTDVYVAGWEVNASGMSVAKLWKNGVAQNFSDGQQNAHATSVFVSGSDVYVAGDDWPNAQLWKNGVKQHFSNGQLDAVAYSVFVSGNNVYVAGGGYWGIPGVDATLWKNGQLQSLQWQGDHVGSSVFVSGSDVFVAGAYGPAILWKNGVAQQIGESNDVANSVFVSGNDVYVVGNKYDYNGRASIWKNGVAYGLPDLNAANSVFVQ